MRAAALALRPPRASRDGRAPHIGCPHRPERACAANPSHHLVSDNRKRQPRGMVGQTAIPLLHLLLQNSDGFEGSGIRVQREPHHFGGVFRERCADRVEDKSVAIIQLDRLRPLLRSPRQYGSLCGHTRSMPQSLRDLRQRHDRGALAVGVSYREVESPEHFSQCARPHAFSSPRS